MALFVARGLFGRATVDYFSLRQILLAHCGLDKVVAALFNPSVKLATVKYRGHLPGAWHRSTAMPRCVAMSHCQDLFESGLVLFLKTGANYHQD